MLYFILIYIFGSNTSYLTIFISTHILNDQLHQSQLLSHGKCPEKLLFTLLLSGDMFEDKFPYTGSKGHYFIGGAGVVQEFAEFAYSSSYS